MNLWKRSVAWKALPVWMMCLCHDDEWVVAYIQGLGTSANNVSHIEKIVHDFKSNCVQLGYNSDQDDDELEKVARL